MNKELTQEMIEISIPHRAEYVSLIRLTVASIANRMGFDIEDIEDIKVALSEACSNAIMHGGCPKDDNFIVQFLLEKASLTISVSDFGKGYQKESIPEPNTEELREGGLGIFIIKSLMDDVHIDSGNNQGTSIRMIKNLREES
ncbi:serine/threonine-protein kinase RsbW [Tindallia magadiensis]|uniref:Serine/threonine-protein kinase RsbW n=1 Tax=Tindallia magadiensis TaxID=69895 RepID=A0A1I3G8V1_9FIRM|nr:ATP-binding protein [Tindallia magadiensis]SFI19965.1 serine/threonine-protein kinase RsbW [Tindallia magadiensis]